MTVIKLDAEELQILETAGVSIINTDTYSLSRVERVLAILEAQLTRLKELGKAKPEVERARDLMAAAKLKLQLR